MKNQPSSEPRRLEINGAQPQDAPSRAEEWLKQRPSEVIQQKEAPERHEELFQAEDNEVEMGDATLEQLEEARDSATSELTNLDSIGPMTRKKAARMGELQLVFTMETTTLPVCYSRTMLCTA